MFNNQPTLIELPEGSKKFHHVASFCKSSLLNNTLTATTVTAKATTATAAITTSSNSSSSSSANSGSSSTFMSSTVAAAASCPIASKFIDAFSLIKSISNSIILDCRVLREFESKHIQDSVHINCRDKITKKRLSTKKLSVKDIISCDETKQKLEKCVISTQPATTTFEMPSTATNESLIVLYDDSTNDENDLVLDQNPLQIVLENIRHTFKNNNCKILKGGFKEFSKQFPNLCVEKDRNQSVDQQQQLKICAAYNNYEESFRYAMDNAKLTKITENLYLGNECDAKNEEKLLSEGITCIINVTKNIPLYHENSLNNKFKYKRIAVNDACNQNLRQYFDETNKFIDDAKERNEKVLVHCQAGISRSPTIVIAYLMKNLKLTMNDAYNKVKDVRPIIGPNIIFLSQLYDYEKTLFETSTTIPVAPVAAAATTCRSTSAVSSSSSSSSSSTFKFNATTINNNSTFCFNTSNSAQYLTQVHH